METLRLHIRDRAAPPDPSAPVRGRLLPDDVPIAIAIVERLSSDKESRRDNRAHALISIFEAPI
jgi:hypothetical protein